MAPYIRVRPARGRRRLPVVLRWWRPALLLAGVSAATAVWLRSEPAVGWPHAVLVVGVYVWLLAVALIPPGVG